LKNRESRAVQAISNRCRRNIEPLQRNGVSLIGKAQ